MRGFLSGVVTGGLVSCLAAGTASVLMEQRPVLAAVGTPQTDTATPEVALAGVGGDTAAPAEVEALPTSADEASVQSADEGAGTPTVEVVEAPAPSSPSEDATSDLAEQQPEDDQEAPGTAAPEEAVAAVEQNTQTAEASQDAPIPEAIEADASEQDVIAEAEQTVEDAVAAPDAVLDLSPDGEGEALFTDETVVEGIVPNVTDTLGDAVEPLEMQGDANGFATEDGEGIAVLRPSDESAQEAVAGAEQEQQLAGAQASALSLYSEPFELTGGQPRLAIVLLDETGNGQMAAALTAMPFPVTVALDPASPNANSAMLTYREAGFEVVAAPILPPYAQPSDVEVTLSAAFQALPQSIGLADFGAGGFQEDREVTEQTLAILAEGGRGFVGLFNGLNTIERAAAEAQVPAARVFRDLDGAEEDARAIRRFVDQAAFRARQDGEAVLVGRMQADTISALILWGSANQSAGVSIVPLSGVLGRGE